MGDEIGKVNGTRPLGPYRFCEKFGFYSQGERTLLGNIYKQENDMIWLTF